VKHRALAPATVQHLVRDGSATTFCVHGSGVIISRLIKELGTARMVATPCVTAIRPALADAARPPGCRMAQTQEHDPSRQELALATIKAVHTAAWFSIESCMVYVIYSGFKGQSDRRAAIAAGVVAAEAPRFCRQRLPLPTH
jgi:hypothetical protein